MGIPTSFGLVDRAPVFMDIAEDFYFRLEPDKERAFLASLKKFEGPIVHGFVRGLEPEDWSIEPLQLPSQPKRALPGPRNLGYPNLLEVIAVARLLLAVRRALRTRPIGDILESLTEKSSGSSAARDPITPATAFRNARRLVPLRGNCLSDSLALMRWLAKHKEGATLVFGAKLDP